MAGGEPPVAALDRGASQPVAAARVIRRQPPRPADEYTFEGANHASALLALKNGAGAENAEAVVRVLERKPDGSLLSNALLVAGTVLESSAVPDPRLVALVGGIALDRSLECGVRPEALAALREASGAEATALLVRATGEDERRIQQAAARALSLGERFKDHAHD